MTADILNLPKWDVIELEEGHAEYIIRARCALSATTRIHPMTPKLARSGFQLSAKGLEGRAELVIQLTNPNSP